MKIALALSGIDDYEVIQNATKHYLKNLSNLVDFQNRSQHHIHRSILVQMRWDLAKKMMSQSPPKKPKFKMDLHSAFVLFDAMRNYSNVCNCQPESAMLSRLTMELFAHLPRTEDMDNLSLMSSL